MKYHSKKYNTGNRAFSLVEILTALAILALMSSSVLVVVNRCIASAANAALQMHAFEVARENMENLLASDSVEEGVDYGNSEKYPEVAWQTIIETFYEPITSRMWIRGISSAQYIDTEGQEQNIELIHWLTDVTKEQFLQLMKDEDDENKQLAEQLIATIEEAAQYAGVDVETIEQWLDNGMLTTEDGSFIKSNLDLYESNNGNPSEEDKKQQVKSKEELKTIQGEQDTAGKQGWKDEIDPKTGLTYGELEQMDFSEIWDLVKNRQR